jgi:hypothetical protein
MARPLGDHEEGAHSSHGEGCVVACFFPGKDRILTAASHAYTAAIDDLARQAGLAA